jgi:hypothetical protein
MNRFLPTLCATLWLLTSQASAGPLDAVVVQGAPPLTEETVFRVGAFWEWMFGAPLTADQQAALRQELTSIWKQDNRAEIQGTAGVVGQHLQLARMSEAEREVARQTLLPRVVELLERSTDAGISRWALALYRSSHRELAAGTPPLTRQASDAYLEVLCFMSNQTTGQAFVPDQPLRDEWARTLAAGYGELTPAQQAFVARMPPLRAALAASWPKLSAGERKQVQELWARQLGIQPGAAGPARAAAPAVAAAAQPAPATDWRADLAAMQRSNAMYQGYSAAIMSGHQSQMNTLFNIGDKPLRYEKKW